MPAKDIVKDSKKPMVTPIGPTTADFIAQDIKKVADSLSMSPVDMRFTTYRMNGGLYSIGHHEPLSYLGGYRKLINTYFPTTLSPSAKITMDEIRRTHTSVMRTIGSYEVFLEELEKTIGKMPPIKITPYKASHGPHATKRALVLVVSDLHIGHDIDPEETNYKYGVIEESRTVAHVVRTACEYKTKYRDETELHLFLLGDMIENELHGPNGSDLLHLQTCRAMWLLTQMVGQLAKHFKKVHVYCTPGNHDRDKSIHPKRAIAQKYNSLGTTIYYGVHQSIRNFKNVEWHQPKTPWIDVYIMGHRVYGTHGDTNFNISNPGKNISTASIEAKMNKINASLRDREEYRIFITAHGHNGLFMRMNNGCNLVVNGGGVTPDSYVHSLDIMESPQCQVMFECTPKYAVGDERFIDMAGVYEDKSLDSIIIPFRGLEN
jgi:hypothetical protein